MKLVTRLVVPTLFLFSSAAVAQTGFRLSSPDIPPGSTIKAEQIFNSFGCSGQNVSPALQWTGAPSGTKSFALILHDPDAPTGVGGFTHWIVYNIPATATGLAKGAGDAKGTRLPPGSMQAPTSFGAPGYGGPCPPAGDKPHRYIFTLYALNVDKLDVPANASQALAGFTINGAKIATATFTGMFGR
ncbi:MAG TPA: YbhB/YbcL family Raf kinase inhibitor-like protein [Vicinamibacterales bacterium]|nr:YbhB/YbcL family Raf kinase inhibitor-like protein [Vicinamibacterales bacterium]